MIRTAYRKDTSRRKLQGHVSRTRTKPRTMHQTGTKGHSLPVSVTDNYLLVSLQNLIFQIKYINKETKCINILLSIKASRITYINTVCNYFFDVSLMFTFASINFIRAMTMTFSLLYPQNVHPVSGT